MNKKDEKKKGVGYSAEDRKSMKVLIERTQPDAGDYVGSGTVTKVKKMKRMQTGGKVMNPTVAAGVRGAPLPNLTKAPIVKSAVNTGPAVGAAPVKGPIRPAVNAPGMGNVKRGGGLARKGVGMALAKGGLAKANGCVMRGKTRGKMV